jgi:tocopherol cyclase
MLRKKIQSLFHPERYHGWGKNKRYFEGWYYKVLTADEKHAFAFIPGIAMDDTGNKQAFIQILDGKKQSADYIKFPADNFRSHPDSFKTEIAGNLFQSDKIILDLENARGELQFEQRVPWPNKWYSPGIMGPYAFVPFMECYHGILSMDHEIQGCLEINNKTIDFTGGRGYMEKDWGHSFPSAYFWMQSNHFSKTGISLKASVAKIPWLGSSFVGFIAGLYFNNQLLQFTTYNSTKLIRSFADKNLVELQMENKNYRLDIVAQRNHATELAAPISGFMDGRISESMTASIEVKLMDKKTGEVLFSDTGKNAGLEVAGEIEEIISG